jgi:hypothetical protein
VKIEPRDTIIVPCRLRRLKCSHESAQLCSCCSFRPLSGARWNRVRVVAKAHRTTTLRCRCRLR